MTKILATRTRGTPVYRLFIQEDQNVGAYLIIYPENDSKSVADYLHDTVEQAKADAQQRYGILLNEWTYTDTLPS